MKKYNAIDATTNPSLILSALQKSEYDEFIKASILRASKNYTEIKDILLNLLVDFGVEILKIIPGRVSTEVDAR